MPITTTRTRFPSKFVEFAELEPAPLEVIKIIEFSQLVAMLSHKQLQANHWYTQNNCMDPENDDFLKAVFPLSGIYLFLRCQLPTIHFHGVYISDLFRFTCHLCSLCTEEIRPLSWSHWAIKFASSWGDTFFSLVKGTLSEGNFLTLWDFNDALGQWCSTSLGCSFMKVFSTKNHGAMVQWCNGAMV